MKDRAEEAKVRGLNHLGTPELKDGVDSKDDLEEGKGLGYWVVLKDVFAPYSKEGDELGRVREKVGTVEGGVSE